MSAEQYVNGPGAGEGLSGQYWYSQSVSLGNTVKCSGQGGWDENGKVPTGDAAKQIEYAFKNVDQLLQAAGLRGWEDVIAVRSYHVGVSNTLDLYVSYLKKRIPCHRPTSTVIGVSELAQPGMLIELEVEAKKQKR
ncbi:endoribonuclease l-PSP domain-containing protein [Cordyceps javanica]|uniref:Endoribonuclease l-PSP domain-containing protein n=1 Tax=Cordyceps javanica TaxID=43265 RepID=A0A545V5Q7_9HYPO|nr:endoribonuclease l-PSP domain-containing protein [Cordyceps javanica]TQW08296.1 endoribonuclease l-PSP domain-containing protein [Cordyceps javanica]